MAGGSTPADVRTIVVATDFSEGASGAVGWATGHARATGARLVFVHAPDTAAESLPAERRRAVDAGLADLVEACGVTGVSATAASRPGRPWEAIADAGEEFDADFVVVGARGHTTLASLLLGSTADRVVRTSRRPVVTVRTGAAASSSGTFLAATDFSEEAALALAAAVRVLRVRPGRRCLVLLHASAPVVGLDPAAAAAVVAATQSETDAVVTGRLQSLAAPLAQEPFEVKFAVRMGYPAGAILDEARASDAGLIALGTRGRSGLAHMMLGSVAERVLHHAPCPVLTVRDPSASTRDAPEA